MKIRKYTTRCEKCGNVYSSRSGVCLQCKRIEKATHIIKRKGKVK